MEWVGAFLSHTIMHIPTLTNPIEAQMTIGSADCLQEMFCINLFKKVLLHLKNVLLLSKNVQKCKAILNI